VRDLHAVEVAPPHVLDARPFDWIIIDTGLSICKFTRAALAASHYVLMPIAPGVFAELGSDLLAETVETMQALVGAPIAILGSLVTQWKDDALTKSLLALAKPHLEAARLPPFRAVIPLDKTNVEKAHLETGSGQRRTLLSHHKASKVAQAYTALVEEVQTHVNARRGV
jgi:cellulose biosynthesis protein BcsQ